MPANIDPIYPVSPVAGGCTLAAANNVYDGTGTIGVVMTAGANGAYISGVRIQALGTNIQTVVRFFRDPGSNATAANNDLIAELTLPATTASATSALQPAYQPLNMALPAGYRITAVLGTVVAAGLRLVPLGGDY